jgi:uncharacterized membrane protein YraQ (UPF0718 family)
MFISIIIEAVPFILLGAFISAVIQVFVSEKLISRVIPKNKFLGVIGAAFMGIIFPVCECAIIPIARRLIKKGVPANIAVTFMLAVPIVNPVVLLSTYNAFYNKPVVVLLRAGFGIFAAITIGLLIGFTQNPKESPIKSGRFDLDNNGICGCGYDHSYSNSSKLSSVLEHTIIEFFDISKYLIAGALISSIFQVLIPRSLINPIGSHSLYSVIAMMLLAFVLSICSEADAFIARTFLGQFTLGSVTAFMILGPMVDIKNAIMLGGTFKRGFNARLITYIFFTVYIIGCIINVIESLGVI